MSSPECPVRNSVPSAHQLLRAALALLACAAMWLLPQAAVAGTVKVALSVPLTGIQAGLGKELETVWRAFAKHANDAQLAKGHKLEVMVLDDAFDPARARSNAEQLLSEGASVFSGTAGIATVQAMMPLLEKQKTPLLGPASGSLVLHKSPAVFHVKASFGAEVDRMASVFGTMQLKRVALVTDDMGDRNALAERFAAGLERVGAKLVTRAVITQQGGKPAEAAAQVMAQQPDAVYLLVIPGLAPDLIKQIRAAGYGGFLAAWSVAASDSVAKALGPQGAGIIFSTVLPSPTSQSGRLRADFHAFAQAQGITPSYRAMEVYITGRVLVDALTRIGAGQPSGAEIWKALESMRDVNVGGWSLGYGPDRRDGSRFVDTMMLTSAGTFR